MYSTIYDSDRYWSLSPKAREVLIFLWSCRHSNSIGFYRLPRGYLLTDQRFSSLNAVNKIIKELETSNWIRYDRKLEVVLCLGWWDLDDDGKPYHKIDNDSHLSAVLAVINDLKRSTLLQEFASEIRKLDSVYTPHVLTHVSTLVPPTIEMSDVRCQMSDDREVVNTPPGVLQEIQSSWNNFATQVGLDQIKKITDKRERGVRARLREEGFDAQVIYEKIRVTPFLLGNNSRGWKCDFDFVWLSPEKWIRIVEGKYDTSSREWDVTNWGKEHAQ